MLLAVYKHIFLPAWWLVSGWSQGLVSTLLGLGTLMAGFSSAAEWNTLWENDHPMLIFRVIRNEEIVPFPALQAG